MNLFESDHIDRNNPLVAEMLRVGIPVKRAENLQTLPINRQLVVTTTLCPLYAYGSLNESELLAPPASIYDSRVSVKWERGMETLSTIKRVIDQQHRSMHAIFTFADRGVIKNNPTADDSYALSHHLEVYQNAITALLRELEITGQLQTYSSLNYRFPQFITTSEVTQFRNPVNLPTNQRARKIINSMNQQFGDNITQGLLQTYGTYDALTSQSNTLNLYYERGELLLNVTNLFQHKNYPRIDILC